MFRKPPTSKRNKAALIIGTFHSRRASAQQAQAEKLSEKLKMSAQEQQDAKTRILKDSVEKSLANFKKNLKGFE